MRLHSFASGLHGWIILGEKDCTPKGVRYAASLGRDANPNYTAIRLTLPNSAGRLNIGSALSRRVRHVERLHLRKAPSGGGFGEVFCVLILTEGGLRFDAVDVAARGGEHGFDVSTIFFVVDGGEALPDSAVFDFVGDAFKD